MSDWPSPAPLDALRLYSCDCCKAPMINATNYRAEACSAGCDTSACLICASTHTHADFYDLLQELVDMDAAFDEGFNKLEAWKAQIRRLSKALAEAK